MATNTFSGARAIFRINDQKVAYGSGVDGTEEVMYEAVDVLDQVQVAEYVPTGYRCNFNCSIFRTVKGTQATTGTKRPPAKVEEGQLGSIKDPNVGIFPRSTGTPNEILTNGWLIATIRDRLTNQLIGKYEQAKAQTLNWSITARGIVGQNVSFNAIRFVDESDPT